MNIVFSSVFGVDTKKWFHITTFVGRTVESGKRNITTPAIKESKSRLST